MTQFLKLQSRQGGPFTNKFNNVDFDVPEDVYDFSRSYINVYGRFDVAEQTLANDDGVEGIYPLAITNETVSVGTRDNLYNVALVRNCSMTTAKAGRIEDIRRVDILRQNLNELTLSEEQKRGLTFYSTYGRRDRAGNMYAINADLYGTGSVKSRNLEFPIKLPLSQLYETGNVQEMPLTQLGMARLHLELTTKNIGIQNLFINDGTDNEPTNYYTQMESVSSTTAGFQVTTLSVLNNRPERAEDIPYWVGQKVNVVATGAGGAGNVDVHRTIQEIEIDRDTAELILTFAQPIATLNAGEALNTIKVNFVGADLANTTFTFIKAEIVLHRVLEPTNQRLDVLNYRTFTTEEQLVSEMSNYRRIFEMEPEAVNVLFMFAQDPERLVASPSETERIERYRVAQDNMDNTDRDVEFHGSLYHDRLVMSFLNMSKPLRNLQPFNRNVSGLTNIGPLEQAGSVIDIIAEPLTMTERMKLVQLNIETSGSITNVPLFIYKQVQRSIKL